MSTSATDATAAGTSISQSTTSSQSTITSDSSSFTSTTESTTSSVSISSVSLPPSTTTVPASSTSQSVVGVTSTITQTPASTASRSATIVIVTSTAPPASTASISTPSSASSTSSPSAISAPGSGSGSKSGGLTTGDTIAIAVVIPIVAIAALFCIGLFLWRRRKQRKSVEEQRKAEIEDYGFNPNQDQTLATAAYVDTGSEMAEDNNGYRGWGTTSSAQRKHSTTLGSGSRGAAVGVAGMSETSSTQGNSNGHKHQLSNEPNYNADSVPYAGAAAIGGAAASRQRSNDRNNHNIHRGPSNASSTYSNGPDRTDAAEELPGSMPGGVPAPYYHEEGPYNYIDAQAQQGPYGDGTYHPESHGTHGGGQPVIRNVQARRNTRIERAPTHPNVGIAQNF